jgi:kinesin family protein C2/C3
MSSRRIRSKSSSSGLSSTSNRKSIGTEEETLGRLYLVDLAGSERVNKSGVKGKQLIEAKHINRSLSALGDVIEALDKKRNHVPYRNSTLTRLLQDALCVRSIVAVIVTVCPTESTADESMSSLYFAQRLRSIEMGVATKKIHIKNNQDENKVHFNT